MNEILDPADFIESMRRMKRQSGLTYRDLEERASQLGDVLPRSTLADVLRRTTLPPPGLLSAFVRACGQGQDTADWLTARNRIAARPDSDPQPGPRPGLVQTTAVIPEPGTGVGGGSAGARVHRNRLSTLVCGGVVGVLLVGGLIWWLLDRSGTPIPPSAASGYAAGGWVTISSAAMPDLCVTDGRDRTGGYASAVAVALPCADAGVPRTYLEPVGEGLFRIQWHHPVEGKGCLTVMSSGTGKGMIEPREDCAQGTLFRLQPTSTAGRESVRLRSATSPLCVGFAGNGTTEGAEAREEHCTNSSDQQFLVRAN
ncbi:helix-turn-helix domain-containing protein [Streptomyces sp. NPDC001822]|uniref:helix-turn-helix domain-containing protein n=1 Tax=Streptomyces sp. NPDC001822 TaxID=3364614 RepID=UPI0036A79E19